MIYKTNGIKQTRKYGRKYKRNMRGGDGDGESSAVIIKILMFLAVMALLFLFAFGNIVQGGGSSNPQ